VVDESFRVVGFDNVYVSDASIFPTSLTVNPQWTILALSSLASQQVLRAHA
jgi:choline dehydrogenase-like flavoprotein